MTIDHWTTIFRLYKPLNSLILIDLIPLSIDESLRKLTFNYGTNYQKMLKTNGDGIIFAIRSIDDRNNIIGGEVFGFK